MTSVLPWRHATPSTVLRRKLVGRERERERVGGREGGREGGSECGRRKGDMKVMSVVVYTCVYVVHSHFQMTEIFCAT